jgi:uncharacterized protein YwgA
MRKLAVIMVAVVSGLTVAGCGGGSARSQSAFCKKVKSVKNDASLDKLTSSQDPAQIKAGFKKASTAFNDMEKKAPTSIDADMKKVAQAINALNTEIQRVNGDVSKIDQTKVAQLSGQDFQTAGDNVTKFAKDKCGVDLNS